MKRINSREKGKRGERLVCELLTKGTGVEWRRTAQVRGKNNGAPDIEAVTGFDRVWVEVKDRKDWTVGCKEWANAWETCRQEADAVGKEPVLIWRASRGVWVATIGARIEILEKSPFCDIGHIEIEKYPVFACITVLEIACAVHMAQNQASHL